MKKIIITGASGFVGLRAARYFAADNTVLAPTRQELDFTDREAVLSYISEKKPDIFLHCGAISDMGECEKNPELSYKINTLAPEYIAEGCKLTGAKLLFCSSDQVYNGCEGMKPFCEDLPLSPVNAYAKEKLEAENRIADILPESVSMRLSWMYDCKVLSPSQHGNLYQSIKKAIADGTPLTFSVNDYRGVTYIKYVVENFEKAFLLPGGVYNFGSGSDLNMFEAVSAVMLKLGAEASLVNPKHDSPRSLRMTGEKLGAFGISFPSTVEGLFAASDDDTESLE